MSGPAVFPIMSVSQCADAPTIPIAGFQANGSPAIANNPVLTALCLDFALQGTSPVPAFCAAAAAVKVRAVPLDAPDPCLAGEVDYTAAVMV
jgi:hypothetical protein